MSWFCFPSNHRDQTLWWLGFRMSKIRLGSAQKPPDPPGSASPDTATHAKKKLAGVFLLNLRVGNPHRTRILAETDRAVCKQNLRSLVSHNTGQFFGEGRVLKLPNSSPPMKRKALLHQHALLFRGHSWTHKHGPIIYDTVCSRTLGLWRRPGCKSWRELNSGVTLEQCVEEEEGEGGPELPSLGRATDWISSHTGDLLIMDSSTSAGVLCVDGRPAAWDRVADLNHIMELGVWRPAVQNCSQT
ncbi:hypothetical protein EYF80_005745 [Liparis tanakae]|uniref:Uncharacterized protein n=1 Tax=Liparis tanakae TaxID=230148 RepID=A0A4Z2J212_9TELE|nr:hypothetical protein EYF80_005745 [Liparis tanakae]